MNHWTYIVAAYLLTGLSLAGYVWHLRQAERRLLQSTKEARHVQP